MSSFYQLGFEKPLTAIERKIEQLEAHARRLAAAIESGAAAGASNADAAMGPRW